MWLLHERIYYVNMHTLNNVYKLELVDGLSKIKFHNDYVCDSCIHGKHKIIIQIYKHCFFI